jgi:hypothetical protein
MFPLARSARTKIRAFFESPEESHTSRGPGSSMFDEEEVPMKYAIKGEVKAFVESLSSDIEALEVEPPESVHEPDCAEQVAAIKTSIEAIVSGGGLGGQDAVVKVAAKGADGLVEIKLKRID